MRETFRADIVYVALLDEAAGLIRFPHAFGAELPPQARGQGVTGKISETGQAWLISEDVGPNIDEIGSAWPRLRPATWACRSWCATAPAVS
jgi:hypothetical protein